jgi:hypothetical protein
VVYSLVFEGRAAELPVLLPDLLQIVFLPFLGAHAAAVEAAAVREAQHQKQVSLKKRVETPRAMDFSEPQEVISPYLGACTRSPSTAPWAARVVALVRGRKPA